MFEKESLSEIAAGISGFTFLFESCSSTLKNKNKKLNLHVFCVSANLKKFQKFQK